MNARALPPLLFALAVIGCGGDDARGERVLEVDADDALRRGPYMGVSCPTGNAIACDRVGLSVVLRDPAARVTARIGEGGFALDDPAWSGKLRDGQRTRFAGFLQPTGLREPGLLQVISPDPGPDRWIGKEPVSAPVRLLIEREDGSTEKTRLRVGLAPGWG